MTTYGWKLRAFKYPGRCGHCSRWTNGGVRAIGKLRYSHLCLECARNTFGGHIVVFESDTPVEAQKSLTEEPKP